MLAATSRSSSAAPRKDEEMGEEIAGFR